MPMAVARLGLRLPRREAQARAVFLIEDALRTASLPGVPEGPGVVVALRQLALGRIGLGESPQAIAARVTARFRALGGLLRRVDAPDAAQAEAVWAEDATAAAVAVTVSGGRGFGGAWWWPRLLPGVEPSLPWRALLPRVLAAVAASAPLPQLALRRFFAALPTPTRMAVLNDLDAAAVQAWTPSVVADAPEELPLAEHRDARAISSRSSDMAIAAARAPQGFAEVVRRHPVDDGVSRFLAAISLADPAQPHVDTAVATAVAALIRWWRSEGTLSRVVPARAARTAGAATPSRPRRPAPGADAQVVRPALARERPRPGRVSVRRDPPAQAALRATPAMVPGLPFADEPDRYAGLPTTAAGAVLLIAVIARAVPALLRRQNALPVRGQVPLAPPVPAVLAATLARLARAGGASRQDPALAFLGELPRRGDAGLARQVRSFLREADRAVRGSSERALTLRRLVQRPGQVRLTATHLDVSFSLHSVDLRVRRLGLDLDPGYVPYLGRVISVHFLPGQAYETYAHA